MVTAKTAPMMSTAEAMKNTRTAMTVKTAATKFLTKP